MLKKYFLLGFITLTVGLALPGYASEPSGFGPSKELNIKHTSSQYDSIIASWQTRVAGESLENYVRDYIMLDSTRYLSALGTLTDEEYTQRLNSIVSPINLPYNDIIRKYLVAYTTTHRQLVQHLLGESQYYFPMIEEELSREGLPLELKFIPMVESALRPSAVSPSGAAGLWQFMLGTGRMYGLEITSMVDARHDPIASTQAACAYLKDLYKIYGDWALVIASYNYGPGNVNKALKRAGTDAKTYWDIYPFLPKETRDYIPALVGLIYAYHYYPDYDIQPNQPLLPLATDTVTIHKNMHFDQVATTLDIPSDLLRMLNPQYKEDVIPAAGHPYPLVLPQREISNFIEQEAIIYSKDSLYINTNLTTSVINPAVRPGGTGTPTSSGKIYKVKQGDTQGAIAKRHKITVAQLSKWNNLTTKSTLRIGQTLKVSQ